MKEKEQAVKNKTTSTQTVTLPKTSFRDFVRGVWVELRYKVKWSTRKELIQDVSVVLGFLVFWAVYIGVWDFLFAQLLKLVLSK
jgi:preprotein translocase, SecE subunit, bacterial